jgi:hypothetical protein
VLNTDEYQGAMEEVSKLSYLIIKCTHLAMIKASWLVPHNAKGKERMGTSRH